MLGPKPGILLGVVSNHLEILDGPLIDVEWN